MILKAESLLTLYEKTRDITELNRQVIALMPHLDNPEWHQLVGILGSEALRTRDRALLDYGVSCGFEFNTSHDAVCEALYDFGDCPEQIAWLKEIGVDILHDRGLHGETPLHLAARLGYTKSIMYLISVGADVNAATNVDDYETPLDTAVRSQQKESVIALLAGGASPHIQSPGWGLCAIDHAKAKWAEGLELLLAADPPSKSRRDPGDPHGGNVNKARRKT